MSSKTTFIDEDPIDPVSIEHRCEDIVEDGALEQRYNFLAYVFESSGVRLMARAYLDDISTVFLDRAHQAGGAATDFVEAPEMRRLVIGYLKRRYDEIKELSAAGSYAVTWSSADEPR